MSVGFNSLNENTSSKKRQSQDSKTPKVRLRNNRGIYQSVNLSRTLNNEEQEELDLKQAEEKLRIIERVSQFREQKLKATL